MEVLNSGGGGSGSDDKKATADAKMLGAVIYCRYNLHVKRKNIKKHGFESLNRRPDVVSNRDARVRLKM